MDIFEQKSAKPMLIKNMVEPFDDPDYIYELKLDGERCIAYCDGSGTQLLNKRSFLLGPRFPELSEIHKSINHKCILDGEIVALKDGKPFFSEIKRRSAITNQFKMKLAAQRYQICFTAFDILYDTDKQVTSLPLIERRKLLEKAFHENERLALSRYIENSGWALYNLTVKENLEGVVAKRKNSIYLLGKETNDWVKFKNLKDDDFVVCGYAESGDYSVSLILGQYSGHELIYKGHVLLGKSSNEFNIISRIPHTDMPPFSEYSESSSIYIRPELVCVVKYMELTQNGMLRQPVFKGLRDDKGPEECIVK